MTRTYVLWTMKEGRSMLESPGSGYITLALNTGYRCGDLLSLKGGDILARYAEMAELDEMLDREYTIPSGDPVLIHLAFIDSGDRTDEVYQYCATRPGLVYPCKGSSQRLTRAPFTESKVDKDGYGDMWLFIVDGDYYKSFIAGRLNKKNDEDGAFLVFREEEDTGWLRQYTEQLCAEQLVKEQDKKGHVKDVWKPIVSHAANHLLDAEVYAIAAAERAGVWYLKEEVDE